MEINDLVFGLDIGTRTVIGTLGYMKDKKWHVMHHVCMEHEERAMLDGQVHDIEKVAYIVNRVKETLEAKSNMSLTKVNIAAAGRVLNTQMAYVTKNFEELHEMMAIDLQNIQVEGIDAAKSMLEKEAKIKASEYFCVGHTVISYFVDDYMILNPEGHKGEVLSAKILATFLPKSVVDSLYAVTNRVGLEVSYLTLEPIAAINAVIPENIRLLNLALVDIGAGTSDIAITKEGSVAAYGMIAMAGDEVTEKLVHQYLVDFNTAEKMKHAMTELDQIEYEDIIGLSNTVSSEELRLCIEPTIKKLAQKIAKKILELNGRKATNAVFCIGGGSQMPGLIEHLATELMLPVQRVSLRLADQIPDVIYECEMTKGPEMITPLGIAMTAAVNVSQQFTKVKLNGESVILLNTKKLTVLDALLHAGVEHTHIFPTRGKTLMFKYNEERIRIKGGNGEVAVIFLNDQIVSLEEPIREGDEITLVYAKQGEDATVRLKQYIDKDEELHVTIDGQEMTLPLVFVNGDLCTYDYSVQEGDSIQIIKIHTVFELLNRLQMNTEEKIVEVNGSEVSGNYYLQDQDRIRLRNKQNVVEDKEEIIETITIKINGEWIHLPTKETSYMFANIFDFIDFDLSQPKGTIQLLLNGENAAVTDLIKKGDEIEIYWEN